MPAGRVVPAPDVASVARQRVRVALHAQVVDGLRGAAAAGRHRYRVGPRTEMGHVCRQEGGEGGPHVEVGGGGGDMQHVGVRDGLGQREIAPRLPQRERERVSRGNQGITQIHVRTYFLRTGLVRAA